MVDGTGRELQAKDVYDRYKWDTGSGLETLGRACSIFKFLFPILQFLMKNSFPFNIGK